MWLTPKSQRKDELECPSLEHLPLRFPFLKKFLELERVAIFMPEPGHIGRHEFTHFKEQAATKTDLRELEARLEAKMDAKMEALETRLEARSQERFQLIMRAISQNRH
eukprot:Blabericola_migrator_1__8354@NODE_4343_length_1211_cov_12_613636_g2683_i0_p2_GENE_NODE_4343_length_1211_cov_12_613636_g2683_i0NODE_4343_length_1211_cov_12_613636_g2683_i0_p2_ORF_typecomplete_len108_score12_46GBP_C/PF02841_14/0_014Ints3/PF10189_9/0_017DUF16/PF01519_16/0_039Matrilin_ccoil/PF10393_9/0_27_NODE_4343_length_1211_cov_12_613636_g2683_i0506829